MKVEQVEQVEPGDPRHPEPPENEPEIMPRPPAPKGDWVRTSSSLNTSDFDETKLCLPTKRGTCLAVLCASSFTFLGLLAFSFAELGFANLPKEDWSTLLWRLLGWEFMFYIPVMCLVQPILRNFVVFGLQPQQTLADAWPDAEDVSGMRRLVRAYGIPCCMHMATTLGLSLLNFVPFQETHLGFIPYLLSGAAIGMPLSMLMVKCCAPMPPNLSRSYGFRMLPMCGFVPFLGSAIVMLVYIPLRELGGVWIGLLMPLFLSSYELLGSFLVTRRFTEKFMMEMEVRQAYTNTNQGIAVSIAICNLHAMAEGARLTLLYVDNQRHDDLLALLVPMLSGVVWNVLMRIGCLDCFLHFISRQRWKPNNSGKLLRESGYCMGYPRFGAILALVLVRLCIGRAYSWDATELQVLCLVFLAEMVEDLCSYILWRLDIDVSPGKQFATDQEVEVKAQRRISRRLSQGSLLAVSPQVVSQKSSGVDGDVERWKVRVAHDFKFGPKEFGRLPFWAHFMPTVLAQFHTIFSMIVVSNGLVFLLGLCDFKETGQEVGLVWWPISDDPCHG